MPSIRDALRCKSHTYTSALSMSSDDQNAPGLPHLSWHGRKLNTGVWQLLPARPARPAAHSNKLQADCWTKTACFDTALADCPFTWCTTRMGAPGMFSLSRPCRAAAGETAHLSPPADIRAISVFQDMPLMLRTREHTVGTLCSQLCFRRSKHSWSRSTLVSQPGSCGRVMRFWQVGTGGARCLTCYRQLA